MINQKSTSQPQFNQESTNCQPNFNHFSTLIFQLQTWLIFGWIVVEKLIFGWSLFQNQRFLNQISTLRIVEESWGSTLRSWSVPTGRFPENVSQNTTRADLAGKDSWFTMNILQIDNQFLTDDVDTWSQSQAYQSSLRNILAVNVVNDSVERGVKLSSDFLAAAHSKALPKWFYRSLSRTEKRIPILEESINCTKTNWIFIQNGCYIKVHT